MRALATTLLLCCAACGPAIEVDRFLVTVATIERCVTRGTSAESCEEPEPVLDTVPVVIETVEERSVVLYAADPDTGTERAYYGTRDGDTMELRREQRTEDPATLCTYVRTRDLSVSIEEEKLIGAERLVSDESAGCNEFDLATVERTEWSWQGERQVF